MQIKIQVLFAGEAVAKKVAKDGAVSTKVARLQIFNETSSKVSGFVTACGLYISMKIREAAVEEQIQWILSYIQGGLANI